MKTVIVLNKDQMGQGEADLGRKLLATCLRKLPAFEKLSAIIFYNKGVKVAAKGSPWAGEIKMLEESGVDMIACGTCVEYYGLKEEMVIERVMGMDDILTALGRAEKVITL